MIDVNCYFCGSAKRSEKLAQEGRDPYLSFVNDEFHKKRRSWWVCQECGFIYRSPTLDDKELSLLYESYEKDVFKDTDPDEYFDKIVSLPPESSENFQKSEWLKSQIQIFTPKLEKKDLRILDVGCGGGTLLKTLSQVMESNNTFGVELNPVYAKLAARRSGATIINTALKAGLWEEPFELIVTAKVLEHISDPLPFLQEITELMIPESLFFIEVPDVVDFENLKSSDPRFFIPHLYYFSSASLSTLISKVGCQVVSCRTVVTWRNRSYLQMLVKKNSTI
jgi:2-polyprenyl-3-methyl-5-hydroxy-6-metoxy-1,4-benzoquinol methylase